MKRYEIYGIVAVYLLFISAYFVVLLPSERSQSLRPLFDFVAKERDGGPVYLFQSNETLRGAAFFYLGKESPVLQPGEPFPEEFGKTPGTTIIRAVNPQKATPQRLKRGGIRFRLRFQIDRGRRRYLVYLKQ
jgi:hypothetical protein